MRRLLAAVMVALALAACTPDEPKKGWVVNRGHSSAYTTWVTSYDCYARDKKTGVCTNQQVRQTPVQWPERWWLILKKENGDYDKAYVSSEVWESQPVNSWYKEISDEQAR